MRAQQLPSRSDVQREFARRSLMRFIPWRNPRYKPPVHLRPMVDRLERMLAGESMRVVFSTPPRHAKTETLLNFLSRAVWKRPDLQHAYCSYDASITRSKSKVALNIAKEIGVQLDTENVTEWLTKERGGVRAKSVTEGLTGHAITGVGVIDDPVKGRLQAESARYRERLRDWFEGEFITRLEPGASALCCMARWHPDDLAGWLIREKGWEEVRLPALDADGRALWPEVWPAEAMRKRREEVGEYVWASLYQGEPRPRGGAVFGDPYAFEKFPTAYRTAIGLDFAYSKKTSSDWSVIVVMAKQDGYYYVLDVIRRQMQAPQFTELVKQVKAQHPGARMRWYGSGIEVAGVASFMRPALPSLEAIAVGVDKFVRAQPYAAAWNAGKVLLPENAPWLDQFIAEHVTFTGVTDTHDDVIDAAVAAFDILQHSAASTPEADNFEAPRRY